MLLGGLSVWSCCFFFFLKQWKGLLAEMSHGPQLPAGCVDQLQDCSLSGDGQKKGREKQLSGGKVVRSSATGRGLNDAKLQAPF